MLQIVRKHYPDAQPSGKYVSGILKKLKTEFNISPEKILFAHSVCADDVNAIKFPEEGKSIKGPFNLGGLDGIPFTGKTGLAAFASHVPEDGCALIFYAPHIGITANGEVGKILREGQSNLSTSCGAAMAAIKALQEDKVRLHDEIDGQQVYIENLLNIYKSEILGHAKPVIKATELIYEHSRQLIQTYLNEVTFTFKYLVTISGIIINTDKEYEDYLEVREARIYHAPTKKMISNL